MDAIQALQDMGRTQANAMQAGAAAAEREARARERAVLAAYDRALLDAETKIPTYLMAALEALRA